MSRTSQQRAFRGARDKFNVRPPRSTIESAARRRAREINALHTSDPATLEALFTASRDPSAIVREAAAQHLVNCPHAEYARVALFLRAWYERPDPDRVVVRVLARALLVAP